MDLKRIVRRSSRTRQHRHHRSLMHRGSTVGAQMVRNLLAHLNLILELHALPPSRATPAVA
ncbi:hypothetical protein QQS21_005457 [Conoideocrella luteorostrata]|uniref:Uncharacterized protein n=1 Tax=Conoideocrella luteorostrata TaxID=1105319 RepID=A0AAJ0CPN2_9HYPO|nr:hypothetical protein QQS21_005457 [Conoideocrella luteorostrata]